MNKIQTWRHEGGWWASRIFGEDNLKARHSVIVHRVGKTKPEAINSLCDALMTLSDDMSEVAHKVNINEQLFPNPPLIKAQNIKKMSTDTKPIETSLLRGILSRFENELIEMERQANGILNKACLFKDFREPSEPKKDNGAPQGIIEEFDQLLDNMNSYNDILSQAQKGLTESVGE